MLSMLLYVGVCVCLSVFECVVQCGDGVCKGGREQLIYYVSAKCLGQKPWILASHVPRSLQPRRRRRESD